MAICGQLRRTEPWRARIANKVPTLQEEQKDTTTMGSSRYRKRGVRDAGSRTESVQKEDWRGAGFSR